MKNEAYPQEKIRNIAIIAHVDHGKTTLIDALLKASGAFRQNEKVTSQVMDSNALEKERGITITAKNAAVFYKGYKINIIDTPGHADFGGEVERSLKMVDGVLLLVDAHEGPMPQTRFVLKKAMALNLKPIVLINKIDKPGQRIAEVEDLILDLFLNMAKDDDQLNYPVLYTSAKRGGAFATREEALSADLDDPDKLSMDCLFQAIIDNIPAPEGDPKAPAKMLVSNIDFDSYVGRILIGKVTSGTIDSGKTYLLTNYHDEDRHKMAKISKLMVYDIMNKVEVEEAGTGDIVCISGMGEASIGDTISDPADPTPLPFVKIDDPTISMLFKVNDSPFAGREGSLLTSRQILDRLEKEVKRNIAMQFETTDSADSFIVKGRGELHISILIEQMRREGFELQIAKPQVITKEIDGKLYEPKEALQLDVPEEYAGICIEKLGSKKAELLNMTPTDEGWVRMEFVIPSRALLGYRSQFMTDTKGLGVLSSNLDGYMPWQGELPMRTGGVLVASERGTSTPYALFHVQDRGQLIIHPGTEVYEGMVVGSTMYNKDIVVNVCKKKQMTNMRAAGSDEALILDSPLDFSLEGYMEFMDDDEYLEITPDHMRLRKQILDTTLRLKEEARHKPAKA